MDLIQIILSILTGYKVSNIFSHPHSKVWQKLPRLKIKNHDVFPNIRITIRGRVLHIHHWFNFSILLCISIFVTGGMLDSWITRGFLMGGIAQGLRFSDRSIFQNKG